MAAEPCSSLSFSVSQGFTRTQSFDRAVGRSTHSSQALRLGSSLFRDRDAIPQKDPHSLGRDEHRIAFPQGQLCVSIQADIRMKRKLIIGRLQVDAGHRAGRVHVDDAGFQSGHAVGGRAISSSWGRT